MTQQSDQQPAKPSKQAALKGVDAELSAEALHNLTGWFDVLIQMDLAQKIRNEIRSKESEEKDNQADKSRV